MVTCDNCGGDGGWPARPGAYDEGWVACPVCGGSGWVYGDQDPLDIDDLPPPVGDPIGYQADTKHFSGNDGGR